MQNEFFAEKRRRIIRAAVIAAAVLLVAALAALAVASFLAPDEIYSKEALSKFVEEPPKNARTVLDCLEAWNFPGFDTLLFKAVETCFNSYYYKNLPEAVTLARQTAAIFLDSFYDTTDLTSKNDVTDALIDCYIMAVGDRYAEFRSKDEQQLFSENIGGKFAGIGVAIQYDKENSQIIVISPLSGSPAEAAGILAGDAIVAIAGARVSDVGYYNALNLVRGEIGTAVEITVLRNGTEVTYSVVRAEVEEQSVSYKMLDSNVGYISISGFKSVTAKQFVSALDTLESEGARAFIFDLRSNPGGLVSAVAEVLSCLVPTGTPLASFSSDKKPILAREGEGTLEPTDRVLTAPSVVLCNGSTASAGELFCAALRDFEAMGLLETELLGQTTYGKGVMQSTLSFADGSALMLTTALYNPPSGVNYDGLGVVPDVMLNVSEDHIEEALKTIYSMSNGN